MYNVDHYISIVSVEETQKMQPTSRFTSDLHLDLHF